MEFKERNLITRIWIFCHSEYDHVCLDHPSRETCAKHVGVEAFSSCIVVACTPQPLVISSILRATCKQTQQLTTILGGASQQCCIRLNKAKSLTGFKLCLTTAQQHTSNMQQGVQTDTTCNFQQCWDLLANNALQGAFIDQCYFVKSDELTGTNYVETSLIH